MPAFDVDRIDGPAHLADLDRGEFLRSLATAGAQVRRAATLAAESALPTAGRDERPRAVVVAAMGADDLVADVAATLAAASSPIGVTHARGGSLPGWVGPLDLVLAVSVSGSATGPVQLADEAGRRGAMVVGVSAPASPLAYAVGRARGLHLPLEEGGRASRTAAWSLVATAVRTLEAFGVLAGPTTDLAAVADRLDEVAAACRPSSESFVNPAKVLATDLAGRIPLILADGALTGVAARRAGLMLARTARTPALPGQLPDAAAALVACLDGPFAPPTADDGGHDIFTDPYLDTPSTHLALLAVRDLLPAHPTPGDAARHNVAQGVLDLAEGRGVQVRELCPAADDAGPLVRLADLIAHIDFAAAYLALGQGLDPTTSPAVAALRIGTSPR